MIAQDNLYIANIRGMRLPLPKLQDKDEEAKALRAVGFPKDWKDVERVLEYRGLPYVPEIIHSKVISRHYNDSLTRHFGIDKIWKVIGQKYH